jgi:hypothetical protein
MAMVFASRILRMELTRVVLPMPAPPVITSTLEVRATRIASCWLSASTSFVRCSTQGMALSASMNRTPCVRSLDPGSARLNELAGRDHRRMTEDGD